MDARIHSGITTDTGGEFIGIKEPDWLGPQPQEVEIGSRRGSRVWRTQGSLFWSNLASYQLGTHGKSWNSLLSLTFPIRQRGIVTVSSSQGGWEDEMNTLL